MAELKLTPLNKAHHDLNARMAEFHGWEMPIWYSSILEEHRAVRSHAGIFDISHMGRICVGGPGAGGFLDRVLTRPASALTTGLSQLCLMCADNGGILDDLFVYRKGANDYLLILNASNLERNLDWLYKCLGSSPGVSITNISADTAMLAVQGPATTQMQCLRKVSDLPRFGHKETTIEGKSVFAARTGYTGEDGFEIIADKKDAVFLWELLLSEGAKPCGLAARDSLRLEAGMLLNGQDMDTGTNPIEAGLSWLVDLKSGDFIGKEAILRAKSSGVKRKLIGFEIKGREIARPGYIIMKNGMEVGKVTSGGYSPTLNTSIGLGYVPAEMSATGTDIQIIIRDKVAAASIVRKPFYRREVKNES